MAVRDPANICLPLSTFPLRDLARKWRPNTRPLRQECVWGGRPYLYRDEATGQASSTMQLDVELTLQKNFKDSDCEFWERNG